MKNHHEENFSQLTETNQRITNKQPSGRHNQKKKNNNRGPTSKANTIFTKLTINKDDVKSKNQK